MTSFLKNEIYLSTLRALRQRRTSLLGFRLEKLGYEQDQPNIVTDFVIRVTNDVVTLVKV